MGIEQLGPYRIGRLLGRGGMGSVYAAEDIEQGKPAAVKVLSPSLAAHEDFRERFEVEIETLRKLRHPNIVRIFGFGENQGILFYAMELVEGRSLEELLNGGRRFDHREVIEMACKLCRALKHAHDRGVIHRDIKPANLLLSDQGDVKLTDFGIARLFGMTRLTSAGGVVGTAEYMAPEQCDGRRVTERSDLYSLGGVLFALLAGRPPFVADTVPQMLQLQRFAEPEPVRAFAPDTPEALDHLVRDLLAKEPSDRVPNATMVLRRLEAMQHGLSRLSQTGDVLATDQTVDSADFELSEPDESDGRVTEADPRVHEQEKPPSPSVDVTGPIETLADDAPPEKSPRRSDANVGETTMASPSSFDEEVPEPPPKPDKSAERVKAASTRQKTPIAATSLATASDGAREDPATTLPPPSDRFTTVDDEDVAAREEASAIDWSVLLSPQTWMLAVGLLVAIGTAIYMMRPVTADQAYERLVESSESADPEALLSVSEEAEEFLTRFPEDPRRGEVEAILAETQLAQLERRLERRATRPHASSSLLPVEQAYLEAIGYARIEPERGAAKLRAMIELFGTTATDDERATQCVELARRRLERLTQEIVERAEQQQALLAEQLDRARRLATQQPAKAARRWEAIIELYGNKPWAAAAVAEARTALAGEFGSDEASETAVASP